MSLTSLERQASKLVNSDACPRPTTQRRAARARPLRGRLARRRREPRRQGRQRTRAVLPCLALILIVVAPGCFWAAQAAVSAGSAVSESLSQLGTVGVPSGLPPAATRPLGLPAAAHCKARGGRGGRGVMAAPPSVVRCGTQYCLSSIRSTCRVHNVPRYCCQMLLLQRPGLSRPHCQSSSR